MEKSSRGREILKLHPITLPSDRHAKEVIKMADPESDFLLPNIVDAISHLSPVTRWRREKADKFPRRIKLSARKIAYRRSEIEEWQRDPEGWAPKRAAAAAEVMERDDGQFQLGRGATSARRFAEPVASAAVEGMHNDAPTS
jgi:predicted DNA-binding transcriptional regulator AlpA